MAAPFGFGIGDFIAVGTLAHRIVTALSDSRGSQAEYRDLISTLSSLKHILQIVSVQFLELASSGRADTAFTNGIKHQLSLCYNVMEDFLLSSQKYTKSLLPKDKGRSFRGEFRKITYCIFRTEDVQRLHSTLKSHVLAFIMLTNAVTGQCLYQVKQLTLENHAVMVEARDMTARMQEQLNEKFAILVSLITQPPPSLGYTWEGGCAPNERPIHFEDALGRSFSIPLVFCRTTNTFHEALKILFSDVPGQHKIDQREYELVDGSKEGSVIKESEWELRVNPGGRISMNIVIRIKKPMSADSQTCPRCGTGNRRVKQAHGSLRCLHCQLTFRATEHDRIIELPDTPIGESDPLNENSGLKPVVDLPGMEKSQREDCFRRIHYWYEAFETSRETERQKLGLDTRMRDLGVEHPDTLSYMHNLALDYLGQGRDEEAEGLLKTVIDTQKKVIGPEHPYTLLTMHNLALTYIVQDRDEEAVGLLKTVLDTQKKVLGDEHPSTLESIDQLVSIYSKQGRHVEAKELQNLASSL